MPTTNSLPSSSSHLISLATAVTMTTDYRTNRELILDSTVRGNNILPLSETFNRGAIEDLLALSGCAGIRIYYGMDDTDKVHAILVAVTEGNEDILPLSSLVEEEAIILESGQRCPPSCPPESVLNS